MELMILGKDIMEEFITVDETYLSEAAQLYKEAFMGEPWNDEWSDEKQLMEYIREVSGGYNSLNYGLLSDGKLVALSLGAIRHWWEGTNYNINELCVAKNLQGQGIGSRFLEMIEEDIKKRGLAGIFLQTDKDKPSYRFYRKNSFTDLDIHVSLYKKAK